MKRCPCCKKELPESDFWKNAHAADGLQSYCKRCHAMMTTKQYKAKVIRQGLQNMVSAFYDNQEDYAVKGVRVNVLNHVKKGENRYNIQNLNTGEFFATQDKEKFFIKLENILKREW